MLTKPIKQQYKILDKYSEDFKVQYIAFLKRFNKAYKNYLKDSLPNSGTLTLSVIANSLINLESILDDAGMNELLAVYNSGFKSLTNSVLNEFDNSSNTLIKKLGKIDPTSIEALLSYQNDILVDRIKPGLLNPIKNALFSGVLGDIDRGQLIDQLSNLELGLSPAQVETEVVSKFRNYQDQLRLAKAKDQDMTYYQYIGPDDELTRPACAEYLAGSSPGLPPGWYNEEDAAAITNDPERAYNCRHSLFATNEPPTD